MWGRIGPKGHWSRFNFQREKDWFPKSLGGRKKGEGWGPAADAADAAKGRGEPSEKSGGGQPRSRDSSRTRSNEKQMGLIESCGSSLCIG